MRKLLRSMAKAEMERRGYAKVNRLMSEGRWREVLGVYPGFLGAKRLVTAFRVLLFIVMILSWLGHVADSSGSKGNSYVLLFALSGALLLASFPVCGT